ncbi:MAG: helix-turn-helix transcriptional regulator [Lachnospiraceae bacterium]|nr:helix-turn-helix transcriptional regulator [Lachnospiraceae bacterium]MBR3581474.1 helix-turn-helix transcriptional regulator [Lachnospiraceae bacterium]
MICAYDELYIDLAQKNLGDAFDFALVTLGIDINYFNNIFSVSRVSKQFSEGNPKYVAGMNGCELARTILDESGLKYADTEDAMYPDKSPEYWAGWTLAYYQWESRKSFGEILSSVPLSSLLDMYNVYHQMDISKSVEYFDAHINTRYSRLRAYRTLIGLSQSALSKSSGVALRQIQLFEQGERDINKTSAQTLFMLSKALGCQMQDLLEI